MLVAHRFVGDSLEVRDDGGYVLSSGGEMKARSVYPKGLGEHRLRRVRKISDGTDSQIIQSLRSLASDSPKNSNVFGPESPLKSLEGEVSESPGLHEGRSHFRDQL